MPHSTSSALNKWLPHRGSAVLLGMFLVAGILLAVFMPGGRAPWEQMVQQGGRIGGGICAGSCLAALLTMRWWSRPLQMAVPTSPTVPVGNRWFWPMLAGAVLVAMLLRLPLAGGSMWWDELWNVRYTMVGEYRPDPKKPDTLVYRETSYKRALWFFNKPANHPPVSVSAKLCHDAWCGITGAGPAMFSELVLRLPVLLAGLGGILLTGWLLRAWGYPLAGALAAFFMAVHPWLLRYGVDARAYGLIQFLVPLGVLCWWKMLLVRPAQMRWWWGFCLTLVLLMWSHPGCVWICLTLAGAAVLVMWKHWEKEFRWAGIGRLMAVSVVAAGIYLLLMLPCLIQVSTWGDRNQDSNHLTLKYAADSLRQVCYGDEAGVPGLPLWSGTVVVALLVSVAACGVMRLLREHRSLGLLVLCGAVILGFSLCLIGLKSLYFYHRFLIGLGPVFAALVALGATGSFRMPSVVVSLLAFGGFVAAARPQLVNLTTHSYSPWREAVYWTLTSSEKPLHLTGLGHGREAVQLFYKDALEYDEDDPAALEKLLAKPLSEGKACFLAFGYPELHRAKLPKMMQWLNSSGNWVRVWQRDGIEPEFRVSVYRWVRY